jgi:lysozyme
MQQIPRPMIQLPEALYKRVSGMIERHEAKRSKAYDDATGKSVTTLPTGGNLTIGIGRNLFAKPLTEAEIYYLFNNDLNDAYNDARRAVGAEVFDALTLDRQAVLLNMAFNLGFAKLTGFVNTLQAVREGRYADAAKGMKQSLWARQVGGRATLLADMMENG